MLAQFCLILGALVSPQWTGWVQWRWDCAKPASSAAYQRVPREDINNAEHTRVASPARPCTHINGGSRDSHDWMCLHRLTVCEAAWSPNRQSPFPSPSRASWIKMKDKHFLPLFSTSAGAHLINFLISLGTNDLRHSANPKLSLFFLLLSTKDMPEPRSRRRKCMGENSENNNNNNNKISKRCIMSTQSIHPRSQMCLTP